MKDERSIADTTPLDELANEIRETQAEKRDTTVDTDTADGGSVDPPGVYYENGVASPAAIEAWRTRINEQINEARDKGVLCAALIVSTRESLSFDGLRDRCMQGDLAVLGMLNAATSQVHEKAFGGARSPVEFAHEGGSIADLLGKLFNPVPRDDS